MKEVEGGFTDKRNDPAHGILFGAKLFGGGHRIAATGESWTEGGGRLTMLAAKGTQVLAFRVPAAFSASRKQRESGVPVLMARRKGVRQTDFVAFFSDRTRTVRAAAVARPDGTRADAVGVRVELKDGTAFHALVNYEPGKEARLGRIRTKRRFATDFPGDRR